MTCNRCGEPMKLLVYPDVAGWNCVPCDRYDGSWFRRSEDYRCFGCGEYDCGMACFADLTAGGWWDYNGM